MPVTTWPSPFQQGHNRDRELTLNANSRAILETVTSKSVSPYENDSRRPRSPSLSRSFGSFGHHTTGFHGLPIIASSIDSKRAVDAESPDKTVSVYNNGFVEGLIRAFNQDLHLVIRPDDVWQAILSQFSLFINGGRNAERLRHMFVSHEGKKELDIFFPSLSQIDFEEAAQEFASLIQQNVVDPELRDWMLPNFSTTTKHDKAVAAFGMMGAMKKFFGYGMMGGCGLPSVTLLGTRHDWEMLASRVNKLNKYGDECQRWANLLQPIMRYMQRTFDEPDSQEVKDFWLRVAWETGHEGSSGDSRLISGWITAFAYFEDSGSVTRDYEENTFGYFQGDRRRLILDGVSYPLIRPGNISSSLVLVPVTITDLESRMKKFSTVISGTVGMSISAGATSQPVSAWWIVQEFETPI